MVHWWEWVEERVDCSNGLSGRENGTIRQIRRMSVTNKAYRHSVQGKTLKLAAFCLPRVVSLFRSDDRNGKRNG